MTVNICLELYIQDLYELSMLKLAANVSNVCSRKTYYLYVHSKHSNII